MFVVGARDAIIAGPYSAFYNIKEKEFYTDREDLDGIADGVYCSFLYVPNLNVTDDVEQISDILFMPTQERAIVEYIKHFKFHALGDYLDDMLPRYCTFEFKGDTNAMYERLLEVAKRHNVNEELVYYWSMSALDNEFQTYFSKEESDYYWNLMYSQD